MITFHEGNIDFTTKTADFVMLSVAVDETSGCYDLEKELLELLGKIAKRINPVLVIP